MSRIAKKPVALPSGVTVTVAGQSVTVKGSNGQLTHDIHPSVAVEQGDAQLTFAPRDGSKGAMALAGTTRAIVGNMVTGVSEGFKKELQLVGVGYRAALQGKSLNLSLGFSHPIEYALPEGITAEVPAATGRSVPAAHAARARGAYCTLQLSILHPLTVMHWLRVEHPQRSCLPAP